MRGAASVAVAFLVALCLSSCFFSPGSLSRDEVQGQWTSTVDGHAVHLDLSSDGTATVEGIPAAATRWYDDPDVGSVALDWTDVVDLTGTWGYYERYTGSPAAVHSDFGDRSPLIELVGTRLVIYYGYIEYSEKFTFTKDSRQTKQPAQQLVSRAEFVGSWAGGEGNHRATVVFNTDGSAAFTEFPVDLLRSDGGAEIDWSRTTDFTASWLWRQDPLDEHSFISLSMIPRPSGSQFDGTVMDVSLTDSVLTLRMGSGDIAWDRHIEFHRLSDGGS